MNLVDTTSTKQNRFALRPDGTIDFDAYIGLTASFPVGQGNSLITVQVKIVGARTRYGHLDLNIAPIAGAGTRWVEYKNLMIHDDPINNVPTASSIPHITNIINLNKETESV